MNKSGFLLAALVILFLSSCQMPITSSNSSRVELAEFTESFVKVSIALDVNRDGAATIQATFTPTEADGHLYSKDLPKEGIEGLGRPTLIELPPDSQMQAAGALQESLPAENDAVSSDLPALPVYPAGAVTLSLPVQLPEGKAKLVADKLLISYMACTPRGCHKPVVEMLVEVQVPSQ